MKSSSLRKLLLFLCLFIGFGAVGGAIGMMADPSGRLMGMDSLLVYFEVLPFSDVLFQNLFFPGLALLIVNGVTNLTAAGLLIAGKPAGIWLGTIFGVTLMLWITIQFIIFPLNAMSTAFFVFGLLQFLTGLALLSRRREKEA